MLPIPAEKESHWATKSIANPEDDRVRANEGLDLPRRRCGGLADDRRHRLGDPQVDASPSWDPTLVVSVASHGVVTKVPLPACILSRPNNREADRPLAEHSRPRIGVVAHSKAVWSRPDSAAKFGSRGLTGCRGFRARLGRACDAAAISESRLRHSRLDSRSGRRWRGWS